MEKLRAGMVWAVALAGLVGVVSGGCASTGSVPQPFPTPGGGRPRAPAPTDDPATAEPGKSLPPDTYALVGTALDLRGVRYRNGGADPGGFDCSGFTQYVFGQHGV